METLAQRFRRLRTEKGLTQIELADLSGIGYNTIYLLETHNGASFKANLRSVARVSETLGVPLSKLFDGIEPVGDIYGE